MGEGRRRAQPQVARAINLLRLAAHPIVVAIEVVNVLAYDVDGSPHVCGSVTASSCAVDVASVS